MLAILMAMLFFFSLHASVKKLCEILDNFTKQDINADNLKCLINFCSALPGCDAAVERGFSLINALWTDEKTDLKLRQ
jgi:hypothetical protein